MISSLRVDADSGIEHSLREQVICSKLLPDVQTPHPVPKGDPPPPPCRKKLFVTVCFNRLVLPLPIKSSQLTCVLLSTVELSSADVHVEDSTGPELWKHCCHQASRADPSHSPPCWIAHQRGLMLGSTCSGIDPRCGLRGVLSLSLCQSSYGTDVFL